MFLTVPAILFNSGNINAFKLAFYYVSALGVLCNAIVVVSNGNKMPVLKTKYIEKVYGERHIEISDETRFKYLGDVFSIGHFAFSCGDVLLFCGLIGVYIW